MAKTFEYDVFLSYSSRDKKIVHAIAKRLKNDGVRVWLDTWAIKGGDNFQKKIEEGLEQSRVLVLCMSTNAFGSDWSQLESHTFRFRDPLNEERRFIPLRLDDAEIKGSLAQFSYIDWRIKYRKEEYVKLLEACGIPAKSPIVATTDESEQITSRSIQLDIGNCGIWSYAFSRDEKLAITGDSKGTLKLWDMETGQCLRVMKAHTEGIGKVVFSANQHFALSGSHDGTIRLWDLETGNCLRSLNGHTGAVLGVVLNTDQNYVLSCSGDSTIRYWDMKTGKTMRVLEGHKDTVNKITFSTNQKLALSSSTDNTVRLWNLETGKCLRIFVGHTKPVFGLAISPNQHFVISGSMDHTIRLWEVQTGHCMHIFEGHSYLVSCLEFSVNNNFALSGSYDDTVRLWDIDKGYCSHVLDGHSTSISTIAWSKDPHIAFSGDANGEIRIWDLSAYINNTHQVESQAIEFPPTQDQVQYTNAKVLLVGETSAGKTGLSTVLAGQPWEPSDSTVGAWATQWKLPLSPKDGVNREIWLWDFGGQADQRLIHQLYMDETALAVLVFDGQKSDVFETLGQWDRDLSRASDTPFTKLLAAGRVDAGGLRVSRSKLAEFAQERGFEGELLETSAKTGQGCEELKQAIIDGIRWENIPWRSSPVLFKRLKDEIIKLKDENRVLMRFNELRNTLKLRFSGKEALFNDDELKAVITLLAGPGIVWELQFGSWILLQPERINAYAQAVIQTMSRDEDERGFLPEQQVLNGKLIYHPSMERLENDQERIILLAMHQTLKEWGLCLREETDKSTMLIFPSYYRRERPELIDHPAIQVSYRFKGFLDDIYATLVVKLHHTSTFQRDELWLYAADFKTLSGKQLGVKLTRRAEGAGELDVYFDPEIESDEKIIFSKYIHEHLLKYDADVERLRHYVCLECGTPVGNSTVAMERLKQGKKHILCVNCEKQIPLRDEVEEMFASDDIKQQVRTLEAQANIALEKESNKRTLVGEVISTVDNAGQISRELNNREHSFDMEIEFISDAGIATEQKVYLLLKLDDSHSNKDEQEDEEIFTIHNQDHVGYWIKQTAPVYLLIQNSKKNIRWMEIREWLIKASNNGKHKVEQINFQGKRFDVMSVRRWREIMLRKPIKQSRALSNYWEAKLSGDNHQKTNPELLPGFPAFRVTRFRLKNIGPFLDTNEITLNRDVTIFLGDNAMGKTTILRCLAFAAIGLVSANEVEKDASRYLRKGTKLGTIEVLFELIPDPEADPDAEPAEMGYFAVGLHIAAGSTRFSALPHEKMTFTYPDSSPQKPLRNSTEILSTLRSKGSSQFGFVTGYSAIRIFEESRFSIQTELKKPENEWVLSLFNPDARLVHPEIFSKLIRGNTSNIEDAPHDGMSKSLIKALSTSLEHLFPDVDDFISTGDSDLQLNGVSLRFGELSDGYRSMFALAGHLLRCALKARKWQEDPTTIHGITLIDEIDLHLHPAWQPHVVQDFRKAFSNIQLIASTHSPLVVGALKKHEVLIMRRDQDGCTTIEHPDIDPQGMGVTGLLKSNLFGLRSTIDSATQQQLDRRNHLFSLGEKRTNKQNKELTQLSEELSDLGFAQDFKDPLYAMFVQKMAQHTKFQKPTLTAEEQQEQDEIVDEIIQEILREESEA